ncbi:hypothetical protein OG21DRAFT_1528245, partial [Imleria badia]
MTGVEAESNEGDWLATCKEAAGKGRSQESDWERIGDLNMNVKARLCTCLPLRHAIINAASSSTEDIALSQLREKPSNACGSWTNNLLNVLHHAPAPNASGAHPLSGPQHQPSPDHDDFIEDGIDEAPVQGNFAAHEDVSYYNPIDSEEHQDYITSRVVDSHPNTPLIYPGGTTFMEQFFNNECA